MYNEYRVITAAEAAALWRLDDSTLRRAIGERRLAARKSGGTWLVTTDAMRDAYGAPKPATAVESTTTVGQTWHVQHDETPLVELGRVPGKGGAHVLRAPDGAIIVIGGYWLRRPGEVWRDVLAGVAE